MSLKYDLAPAARRAADTAFASPSALGNESGVSIPVDAGPDGIAGMPAVTMTPEIAGTGRPLPLVPVRYPATDSPGDGATAPPLRSGSVRA